MHYRHVQWGWIVVPYTVGSAAVIATMMRADGDELDAWAWVAVAGFVLALGVLLVWFSRLEVTVDDSRVQAAFGLGRPSRTIPLTEVVGAERVRNRWWYGFGVRRAPQGWMYNVWGLDAVDVIRADGTRFRIGTDDPDALTAAIVLRRSG